MDRINVKDYRLYPEIDQYRDKVDESEIEAIYEQEREAFWLDANVIAQDYGLGGVWQEGRMGGWLVPKEPRGICTGHGGVAHGIDRDGYSTCCCHPVEDDPRVEKMAGEIADLMREHQETFIARVAGVAEVVGVYE